MIYTVTFNPALDYAIYVSDFKTGTVNRTDYEYIRAGGKGINVSVVLKNLGIENTAFGFTAGFSGFEIERLVREYGCISDFVHIDDGFSRINIKLKSESETEVNGQGPVITEADTKKLFEKFDILEKGDYLVLAGSIPSSLKDCIYSDIMEYLTLRGVNVIVDASKNLLMNTLKYRPFLIKPNNFELGEIFNVDLSNNDKETIAKFAKVLQELGAKNVLVSMAGDGAVLLTEDGIILSCDAPKGQVVNSVGAGDSMVAGFLAGYLQDSNYENAFKMGISAGSASAFSEKLAANDEVLEIYKTLTVNII